MTRGNAMTEAQLHRAVAQYLDLALPSDAVWSTIGHGGGGKIRGAQLKAMGMKAGVPDIFIVYRGHPHFIELKAGKRRPSAAQEDFAERAHRAGCSWAMANSLTDVSRWLCCWAIPLHARLAA